MAKTVAAALVVSLTLNVFFNDITNGQVCDKVEVESNRFECNEYDDLEITCLDADCCYDSIVSSGVPRCSLPKRCSMEESDRNMCGHVDPKVWRVECLAMGCCWFHGDGDARRACFLAHECDITAANRVSCGSNDMADCLARGCCFDDRTDSNIPNCYQANGCDYNTFNENGICTNCNCLQPCDRTTGECSTMCVVGYIGLNCQSDGLPFISTITQDATANSGQPTPFTCTVQDNVQITVTIETESSSYSPTSTTGGEHPNYVNTYTFNDLSVTDGENVKCIATYSGGTRDKTIEATAFVQPVLRDAPLIEDIEKYQVTVKWNAWQSGVDIGDGPIEQYAVWYKKTSENDYTAYPQVVLPSQTSLVVNGLSLHTDYIFAVKTYRPGVGGGGALSPNVRATTKCDCKLISY
ncbi:uncharacterized protein LOC144436782 [Glandiceps talaboti]